MSTTLADAAVPRFARHETFAPRFGWLHKAYASVHRDPDAFLAKSATVDLGVGKNMVFSIRYWSEAFKLTVEHQRGGSSRAMAASPTWIAHWLLDEAGADPYLEDPASLWLLHWWLLRPPCVAPTWWIAFYASPGARFTEDDLSQTTIRHVGASGWDSPAIASIEKDVDCVAKMYAPRKAPTGSPGSFEDLLDCPFRELGLLEAVPGRSRTWRFTDTATGSLSPHVVAYACLDYAAQTIRQPGSVSLARLAHEPGGPGRAFRLTEPALAHLLDAATPVDTALLLSDAIGQRSLVFDTDPQTLAWRLLDHHYPGARERVTTPTDWIASHPDLATELDRRPELGWTAPTDLDKAEAA
jgi:hypothetical protein